MSRLLLSTETKLKTDYSVTKKALMALEHKSTFTPLNEFEQEQLTQLKVALKRVKVKLILKGLWVES